MSKPLGVSELLSILEEQLNDLPDRRKKSNNTQYTVKDAFLSAFSVFFTQSSSFLEHQRLMQSQKGRDNAQTLFGVEKIPCDNQIRQLLDLVPVNTVFPVFRSIYQHLEAVGALKAYDCFQGNRLIALDGTEYFTSKQIHCEPCSQRTHKNGTTTYFHAAITPVLVAPGKSQVISLQPEFIRPQDGASKQDSENAAAKRWILAQGVDFSQTPTTLLGDDLYCHQPMCELATASGFHFLFTCKPDSHSYLYEWLEYSQSSGDLHTYTTRQWDGKRQLLYTYRYANGVPLRQAEPSLLVNWCELTIIVPSDGTLVYRNAFASDHQIDESNVADFVDAGRARWKVENENNNVLKTQGYNLEHNFGHGNNHLSSLLVCLNLLAFLFHTVLELTNQTYQQVRQLLGTRKTFFNDIRALTRYLLFESWDCLLEFILREGNKPNWANSC